MKFKAELLADDAQFQISDDQKSITNEILLNHKMECELSWK